MKCKHWKGSIEHSIWFAKSQLSIIDIPLSLLRRSVPWAFIFPRSFESKFIGPDIINTITTEFYGSELYFPFVIWGGLQAFHFRLRFLQLLLTFAACYDAFISKTRKEVKSAKWHWSMYYIYGSQLIKTLFFSTSASQLGPNVVYYVHDDVVCPSVVFYDLYMRTCCLISVENTYSTKIL